MKDRLDHAQRRPFARIGDHRQTARGAVRDWGDGWDAHVQFLRRKTEQLFASHLARFKSAFELPQRWIPDIRGGSVSGSFPQPTRGFEMGSRGDVMK
jgi:hypothetical protein